MGFQTLSQTYELQKFLSDLSITLARHLALSLPREHLPEVLQYIVDYLKISCILLVFLLRLAIIGLALSILEVKVQGA